MGQRSTLFYLLATLVLSACGSGGSPDGGGTPIPPQSPTCPQNYVKIPANSSLGTVEFCLAQFEMKVLTNDGNAIFDGTNGGSSLDASLYKPESRSEGLPWVRINLPEARAECASLGQGYHLVTLKEWQAAALNIESVALNWSGNAVGSGKIVRGHSDNEISGTAVADGYAVSGSKLLSAGAGADFFVGTGQSSGEQKRVHVLSNGETIWDLSGNAREIVDADGKGSTLSYTSSGISAGFYETQSPEVLSVVTSVSLSGSDGGLNINLFAPATLSMTHATNGVGRVYVLSGGQTDRIVTRGGGFTNSPGLFAADLDSSSTHRSSSGGFRCAKDLQ